jgi:hypothetical protein
MILLKLIGFLWSLPLSIPMWCIVLFLKSTKQIENLYITSDFILIVDMLNDGWYFKKRFQDRGFIGFGFGNTILIKDCDLARFDHVLAHEIEHVFQCYKLGVFFPILYILECLRIYLFKPELHSYYDNRFEIDAKEAANEPVKVPKNKWLNGPKDRWIFW